MNFTVVIFLEGDHFYHLMDVFAAAKYTNTRIPRFIIFLNLSFISCMGCGYQFHNEQLMHDYCLHT